MLSNLKPPIILFGNTRSGTTIVHKIMSTHPDLVGWYEPKALWLYADPGRLHDEFDESDASVKVSQYIKTHFLSYQENHSNRKVFEKTPTNILRISYVRSIFPEATFLYIVRNPFSFISSMEYMWRKPVTSKKGMLRRLKDTPLSQLHHYVLKFINQQYNKRIIRRKYLSIWGARYKGIQEDIKTHDLFTIIARQWSVPSRKAEDDFTKFNDGQVLKLRYEDFVEDPVFDLERICEHCGLDITNEMVNAAKEWVKSDRQDKWRRFDPKILARILPEIRSEMQRHGYSVPVEISNAYNNLH